MVEASASTQAAWEAGWQDLSGWLRSLDDAVRQGLPVVSPATPADAHGWQLTVSGIDRFTLVMRMGQRLGGLDGFLEARLERLAAGVASFRFVYIGPGTPEVAIARALAGLGAVMVRREPGRLGMEMATPTAAIARP